MKKDDSFKDYVLDLLVDFGNVYAKRMFGGWGIYESGIIFAIITDGELYFKVDKENQVDYEKHDSHPFEYTRKGKHSSLSYWLLPEEIMEDREKLFEWAQTSVNVSEHSKKKNK